MPDVGDVVTVTLLVPDFDETTAATLLVTRPDGTTVSPAASSPDGGNTWQAPVTYTMAGVWGLRWNTTGTGAGVEFQQVGVAPDPGYVDEGERVYATTTDLANWLLEAPPPTARKTLRNASRALDDALLTAVYPVDEFGYPADPTQRKAFKEATCAIAEWWGETGDELGAGGDWQSASAGGVSISRAQGQTSQVSSGSLPAKAWGALVRARVLPGTVYQR